CITVPYFLVLFQMVSVGKFIFRLGYLFIKKAVNNLEIYSKPKAAPTWIWLDALLYFFFIQNDTWQGNMDDSLFSLGLLLERKIASTTTLIVPHMFFGDMVEASWQELGFLDLKIMILQYLSKHRSKINKLQ
ncbi:hypothetical protein ACJX0J_025688, partial [Zea mays]